MGKLSAQLSLMQQGEVSGAVSVHKLLHENHA